MLNAIGNVILTLTQILLMLLVLTMLLLLRTTIMSMEKLKDVTAHANAIGSVILTDTQTLLMLLVLTMLLPLRTTIMSMEKLKDVIVDVIQLETLTMELLTQPHFGQPTVVLLKKTAMV
jgi:hypothetical protein